jgi:hypothetical protein
MTPAERACVAALADLSWREYLANQAAAKRAAIMTMDAITKSVSASPAMSR